MRMEFDPLIILVAAILLVNIMLTTMCGIRQLEVSHVTKVHFLGSTREFFFRKGYNTRGLLRRPVGEFLRTGGEFE